MKIVTLIATLFSLFSFRAKAQSASADIPQRIYDFKVAALDGSTIDFSAFRGKKILIVNTASRCGYTPQYEGLERLYEKYKDRLVIVGFPANNFLRQEPGNNEEIAAFCKKNYGVSFPMGAKISVKGKTQAPLYTWLTDKKYNGVQSSSVKWNFQKYLLDETGRLIRVFAPAVAPESEDLISSILQ